MGAGGGVFVGQQQPQLDGWRMGSVVHFPPPLSPSPLGLSLHPCSLLPAGGWEGMGDLHSTLWTVLHLLS